MTTGVALQLPNWVYLGPDKSGSTWLYDFFRWHPDAYVPQTKEMFYFDRYYHRGLEWYASYFEGAGTQQVIRADISHDYLFEEAAAVRIAGDLPAADLVVCAREPIERAVSAFLYMKRQGRIAPAISFMEAVEGHAELLEHGMYARHLERFAAAGMGERKLHVLPFDDLKSDAQAFADRLSERFGLRPLSLPAELLKPSNAASRPRQFEVARLAKLAALRIRDAGFPGLVTRIKSNALVQSVLFRPLEAGDKPVLSEDERAQLRARVAADVHELDARWLPGIADRWGYV